MKKLIALFAILVAMTSFSFAANSATATVKVWTPIQVTVTLDPAPATDILIGGTTTCTFTASGTWDTDATGFNASWTVTTPSTTGGTFTWEVDPANDLVVNASLTGTAKGTSSITATYTVTYGF